MSPVCQYLITVDLGWLLDQCDRMEAAVVARGLAAFTDADIEFQSWPLLASGNRVLGRFTSTITAILRAREELALMPDHIRHITVMNHRSIVRAI